jgi:hypothetical protein
MPRQSKHSQNKSKSNTYNCTETPIMNNIIIIYQIKNNKISKKTE